MRMHALVQSSRHDRALKYTYALALAHAHTTHHTYCHFFSPHFVRIRIVHPRIHARASVCTCTLHTCTCECVRVVPSHRHLSACTFAHSYGILHSYTRLSR
mmetsp:Transcript_11235/g.29664  ORF Transcript_11235/g.29664 Transcript_11235/m.29664 type:complete len:101 (+) Transcript_11235:230-532(+)